MRVYLKKPLNLNNQIRPFANSNYFLPHKVNCISGPSKASVWRLPLLWWMLHWRCILQWIHSWFVRNTHQSHSRKWIEAQNCLTLHSLQRFARLFWSGEPFTDDKFSFRSVHWDCGWKVLTLISELPFQISDPMNLSGKCYVIRLRSKNVKTFKIGFFNTDFCIDWNQVPQPMKCHFTLI